MAKKIKHSDLFQGDVFKPTVEGAKRLLTVTQELRKGLIEAAKDIKKSFSGLKIESNKDLKTFADLTDRSRKAQKAKNDIDKEAAKLNKQIKDSSDDVVKAKIKFNQRTKEQKARLEALLVTQNKEAGTLQKLAARNKLLRQAREKLDLTTKKGIDSLRKINTQLDKNNKSIIENSDALKKQRLNVGNYKDSVKEALAETSIFGRATAAVTDAFNKFKGIFGGVIDQSKAYIASFKAQRAATLAAAKGQGVLAGGLARTRVALLAGAAAAKIFGAALKATGIGLIVAALGALTVAFTKTQRGADDVSVQLEGLKSVSAVVIGAIAQLGFGIVKLFTGLPNTLAIAGKKLQIEALKIKEALGFGGGEEIAKLNAEIAKLTAEGTVSDGFDAIADAISGVGTEAANAFKNGKAFGRVLLEIREQNLALREDLITSGTLLAVANQQAADTTLSFQARIEALEEAGRIQVRVSEAQVKIASNNVRIAREELKRAQDDGLKDIELREKLLTALEAEDSAQTAFALAQLDRDKQRREIQEKALKSEIKIIETQFDRITFLTERQLQDTRKNIGERQKVLEELSVNSVKIFQDEINAIEKATGIRIDSNDLIATSDAKVLFDKIRALNLSDVAEKQLNKTIAARQKQIFEEFDNQQRLNIEYEKNVEAVNKLNKEISALQIDRQLFELEQLAEKQKELFADETIVKDVKRIADEIVKITNNQFDLRAQRIEEDAEEQRRAARANIHEADRLAAELEKIDTDKNNKLRQNDVARGKAIEDVNKKTLETIAKQNAEAANFIIDTLDKAFEKSNERRRKAIDEEIRLREESVERQQALAEKGLKNTLAFEKQAQAAAELERIKQEKREVRRQKVIAYFRAFSEFLQKDPNTAATKALAQVLLADVISGAFATGVEDLDGKGTATSDSNLALLSKGESVVTAKGTKEYSGLATAMNTGKVDEYFTKNYLPKYLNEGANLVKGTSSSTAMIDQLKGVNGRLERLEAAINSKKETQVNLDNLGNVINSEIENGFRVNVLHKRKKIRI